MPTYDYRCAKCGEDLEAFQTFAEAPLTKHKGCGGKLSKVMSPAGIVLKGSGFYKTDNRDSSSKRSAARDKDNGKSSSSDSSSSSSGDSSSSKGSESSGSSSSSGSGDTKSSGSGDKGSGSSDSGSSGSDSSSAAKKPAAKSA
jgi:putative FmdB family regulatory protein